MKIFLSFYSLVLSLCYCLQTESRSCTDTTTKCSGNGSVFNETSQACVCGLDSQHMWGNKCQYGRVRLTSQSGFISEADQHYHGNSKYMFLIESNTSSLPIRLRIEQFSTECNWDYLYIFDGRSSKAPMQAALNGKITKEGLNETRTITTMSGSAFLYFFTDQCTSEDGFNITYEISTCDHATCNSHGICNATGYCVCDHGWSGTSCTAHDCCDKTYLISSNIMECKECTDKNSESIIRRASHAVTVTQSHFMWMYGGISSINNHDTLYREKLNRIHLYDMKERKWSAISKHSSYSSTEMRYGHSLVEYGGSLYVYGGTVYTEESYAKPTITNDLLEFKINTNSWEKHVSSGTPVSGHASVIILDHMYVFFGYNEEYVYFNKVQKLKLSQFKKTWSVVDTKGTLVKGRAGHTATYDQATNTVYIVGGYTLASRTYHMAQDLLMFQVANEKMVVGKAAPSPRVLHSAGIIDHNLVVFGGNANIRSHGSNKCFNNDLLVYSIDCDTWLVKKVDAMDHEMRNGHTSVAVNNSLHVFGGFNGEFLNDVFEIIIGDDCSKFSLETDCLNVDLLSGCVWHKPTKTCIRPTPNIPESSITKPKCQEYQAECNSLPCTSCKSLTSCRWANAKCQAVTSMMPRDDDPTTCPDYPNMLCNIQDSCYACHLHQNCSWNSNLGLSWCSYAGIETDAECFSHSNTSNSCHAFDSCSSCLQSSECLWCESTQMCLPRSAYITNFPYGQCEAYVQEKSVCSAIKCEEQQSCRSCLQLPECGWCDDGGVGRCMNGSADAPYSNVQQCATDKWMFTQCPKCHCNGQSKCRNGTDECISCNQNVVGKHCDRCASGFYGDPTNNGTCSQKCDCNGHLHSCDMKGHCLCNAQGVTGDHCESCDRGYIGDPRDGGICFYPLQANYQYTTRMTREIVAGYILEPKEDKQSYNVEVWKESGTIRYLNLTIHYANNQSTILETAYPLGRYKKKITEDSYQHSGKVFIRAVVYGLKNEDDIFTLKISFETNTQLFDLVYFLIMFIVCFVALLVILSVLWKMKQRYDRYVHNRRQKQEQEERINRPFKNVTINFDQMKMSTASSNEQEKKKMPTLLGMQSLRQANHCGPASFLVQLPRDQDTNYTPDGQCGLCIGTVLIVQPQKRTKSQAHLSHQRKKAKARAIPV